jgi:hypothetical protein
MNGCIYVAGVNGSKKKSYASEWLDKAVEDSKNELKGRGACFQHNHYRHASSMHALSAVSLVMTCLDLIAAQEAARPAGQAAAMPQPQEDLGGIQLDFFDMLVCLGSLCHMWLCGVCECVYYDRSRCWGRAWWAFFFTCLTCLDAMVGPRQNNKLAWTISEPQLPLVLQGVAAKWRMMRLSSTC